MKNILVTGANGQLGREIQELSEKYQFFTFFFTDIDTLDITNYSDLENFFNNHHIDFVINCAAYTAVDKAEIEKKQAHLINSVAPKNLTEFTNKHSSKLIHISTDYVFDGTNYTPYKESDPVNPNSVYGETKLNGEKEVLRSKNGIIIRTSWLYSSYGDNFFKTIIKLSSKRKELNVIFDQVGTPTSAQDLAITILEILAKTINNPEYFKPGIYHYSNEGVCSWYDFAIEIMEIANINCKINPVATKDYPLPANRPHYCVLNKTKIKSTFEISIPHWKDSLRNVYKSFIIKNHNFK